MEQHFGRETTQVSVYGWVRDLSKRGDEILRPMKVATGDEWVADEVAVKAAGRNYWLFNVMDSDTRFLLAAYLYPVRTSRAAATIAHYIKKPGVSGIYTRYEHRGPRQRCWRWRGKGRKMRRGKSRQTGWRHTAMPCRGHSLPARSNMSSVRAHTGGNQQ